MNLPETASTNESVQSQGGKARAAKLSKEQLHAIAKQGACARWPKDLAKATHHGVLKIGDVEIPCFVLEDGRRVISGRSLTTAIGMKGRGQGVARISSHKLITSLDMDELTMAIDNPIKFIGRSPQGGMAPSDGYEAVILHQLCEALLVARDRGLATTEQEIRYVTHADMLIRSFAKIGIIALVDEATGYQRDRAKDALAKILEQFIAKELQAWTRMFPVKFYEEIFRLRKWNFDPASLKRPSVIGHWTNDFIYSRLAPGVLEELQRKNPVVDGRRKTKHTQWLTGDIGHPKLREQIEGVWRLMHGSHSWDEFKTFLNRFYPRVAKTELGFDVEDYSKEELEGIKLQAPV